MNHESLRQRFNPDGSLLRRQQMRMLEILLEVDKICKKHHIEYWLSSGTLIGAMRHNGFIPWDDDLDIEMMRSDYLRLMKVLPSELPEWLALQNDETDPNYFYFYAKVRDRRSRMLEQNGYDRIWKEQGIYIDILPMERHPIWMQKLTEKTVGHMYKIWRTSTDDAKAIKEKIKNIDYVSPSVSSSYQVVNALIKANKEFEFILIPGAHHTMGENYGEHKRADFFVKNLLGVDPPSWDEVE